MAREVEDRLKNIEEMTGRMHDAIMGDLENPNRGILPRLNKLEATEKKRNKIVMAFILAVATASASSFVVPKLFGGDEKKVDKENR